MKILKDNGQKGQSLAEYAIIGAVVIVALILASKGTGILMKNQVEGTAKGFSSGKYIDK